MATERVGASHIDVRDIPEKMAMTKLAMAETTLLRAEAMAEMMLPMLIGVISVRKLESVALSDTWDTV